MPDRLLRGAAIVAVVAAAVAAVTGACGVGDDDAGDATTTTTTAGTTLPPDYSRFQSTDPVAVNLDRSLSTGAELKAALSLPADLVSFPGRGATPPPPQGPMNIDGLVAVFPSPAYRGALETGRAAAGANRTFVDPESDLTFNILAVKFEDAARGREFVRFAVNVAMAVGDSKVTNHPEVQAGALPVQVIRVPPSAGASRPVETVVAPLLYSNGVYYQASIAGPVGAVSDAMAIAFLRAQDAKYARVKAEFGL